MGSPPHPLTLGEWYGLLCAGCTVKWYEKRQLSEPHPKNVSPPQLTCWLPRQARYVGASIFAARLPPCGHQWKSSQHAARELASACRRCYAKLNLVTGSCHFMRMCQGDVRGEVAAQFRITLFHLQQQPKKVQCQVITSTNTLLLVS